jgi:hypothetical protein
MAWMSCRGHEGDQRGANCLASALRLSEPLASIGPMAAPRDPIDLGAPIFPMGPKGLVSSRPGQKAPHGPPNGAWRASPLAIDVLTVSDQLGSSFGEIPIIPWSNRRSRRFASSNTVSHHFI